MNTNHFAVPSALALVVFRTLTLPERVLARPDQMTESETPPAVVH
jgi:hypothetical protein